MVRVRQSPPAAFALGAGGVVDVFALTLLPLLLPTLAVVLTARETGSAGAGGSSSEGAIQ
jgi:hypothetical protein